MRLCKSAYPPGRRRGLDPHFDKEEVGVEDAEKVTVVVSGADPVALELAQKISIGGDFVVRFANGRIVSDGIALFTRNLKKGVSYQVRLRRKCLPVWASKIGIALNRNELPDADFLKSVVREAAELPLREVWR